MNSEKIAFKIILLGEHGVGKTSCFLRVRDNKFYDLKNTTICIDIAPTYHVVDGKKIKLTLIDTAGTERFHSVIQAYYRNSHAVLFMYSVENSETLTNLKHWYEQVRAYAPEALLYLVGNKNDLASGPTENVVKLHANSFGCECVFYVSAKTGQGFLNLLDTVSKNLLYKHFKTEFKKGDPNEQQSIALKNGIMKRNPSCCNT